MQLLGQGWFYHSLQKKSQKTYTSWLEVQGPCGTWLPSAEKELRELTLADLPPVYIFVTVSVDILDE